LNTTLNLNDKRTAQWIGFALFVLTLLTRLPFQSQYLYHWDSVNMAFGIHEYNVIAEAPQYPGYIVYIVLAQVVNLLFDDPQRTMVVISMISSGIAVAGLFYLGREMFNAATGLIAALFLLVSPLFWFYGEIALPHTLDMAAVIICVWLLYKIMIGQTQWIWVTVILLALVGGFRQQTLMFLAPVALLACYRIGLRKLFLGALLGLVVVLVWLIPLMAFSGGLQSYMAGSGAYSSRFFDTTSILAGAGLFGLRRNIISKLIPYTLYGWSLAAVPAIIFVLWQLPGRWRAWLTSRKVWFLVLWVAPSLAFYAFIHMGQQGLTFVFLPALILVSAYGLHRLFKGQPVLLQASTAAIVAVGVVTFVFLPSHPFGADSIKLLTYDTIRESDRAIRGKIAAIRENFSPDNTLLLAGNWRYVQFYLPEYQFARFGLGAKFEVDEGQPTGADFTGQPMTNAELGLNPEQDWQVVLFDPELSAFTDLPLQVVEAPNGYQVSYAVFTPDEAYWTDGLTFGTENAQVTATG
jgi:hypothetical protein